MESPLKDVFSNFGQQIINYLPNLFAGVVLLAVGWLLGWFMKRIVIQLCIVLRLERLAVKFRWGESLHKADIRHGLFELLGNLVFLIVFLIFFIAALDSMKLALISNLLQEGILLVPRLILALIIFGAGWFIASRVSSSIQKALIKEEIPRATLMARFAKAVLLLFFSAMALTEVDVAREIVVIGFAATFVTLGGLTIVFAVLGGKGIVKKALRSLEEE
jgi:hypothetical protein